MRDVAIHLTNGSALYYPLTDEEAAELLNQWVHPSFDDAPAGSLTVVHMHLAEGHRITIRHGDILAITDIDTQQAREIEEKRMAEQRKLYEELTALHESESHAG